MPRRAVDEMTVATLNRLVREMEDGGRTPGLIRVGGVGGLGLNVRRRPYASGAALSASWLLRRAHEGRRRDFALGAWPEVTLAQARERARGVLDKLWAGIDPLAERQATRGPATAAPTFREAAKAHFERSIRGRINQRDESKWLNDLTDFVFPLIGDKPVDQIETSDLMAIAEQQHIRYGSKTPAKLWVSIPERAARMLKKIELIFAAETRLGNRTGDNPAQWRGHLSALLPKPATVKAVGHQPALPHARVPAFFAALREREPSDSSKALQFAILCASRSGEVRGAVWSEFDLAAAMWTIPAERMKMSRPHRVPLSQAALAIIKSTSPRAKSDLVFPGASGDKPLSDATLAAIIRKMHNGEVKAKREGWIDPTSGRVATPHGFRSSFRDWCAEMTHYPSEMAELALAHDIGSKVEQAYRRSDLVAKRREMMEAWAEHVLSEVGSKLRVVG